MSISFTVAGFTEDAERTNYACPAGAAIDPDADLLAEMNAAWTHLDLNELADEFTSFLLFHRETPLEPVQVTTAVDIDGP